MRSLPGNRSFKFLIRVYPQPIRSVTYPKGINELISQYKPFAFSLKHFLVLAQVVVNEYRKGVVM